MFIGGSAKGFTNNHPLSSLRAMMASREIPFCSIANYGKQRVAFKATSACQYSHDPVQRNVWNVLTSLLLPMSIVQQIYSLLKPFSCRIAVTKKYSEILTTNSKFLYTFLFYMESLYRTL